MLEYFNAKINAKGEQDESGFTLIELLVVILIIGILAAIAIPMFLNQRKSAVDSSVQSDLKNAALAAETSLIKKPGEALTYADLTDAKLTEGNAVQIYSATAEGYCLIGYSADSTGSYSTENPLTYDSLAGGLDKKGGSCPEEVSLEPVAEAGGPVGGAIGDGATSSQPQQTVVAKGTQGQTATPEVQLIAKREGDYIYINATSNAPGGLMTAYVSDIVLGDDSNYAATSPEYKPISLWDTTSSIQIFVGDAPVKSFTLSGTSSDPNANEGQYNAWVMEGSHTFNF